MLDFSGVRAFLFCYGGFWASRFGAFRASRRAIRSITFALRASVVPLLSLSLRGKKK